MNGLVFTKLEEGMNFPDGKEAIKVDIWSPAGTQVLIKPEDEMVQMARNRQLVSCH